MSTPQPSPQDAISADGFFKSDDAELGERVQQMDEDAVALASERGLDFYRTNVLQHPQIRPVIETALKQPSLGVYRSFGPSPCIYCLESHEIRRQPSLEILIVMLWSKGSKVSFWPGSHRHWLDPAIASNSLLEVPEASLHRLKLEATEQRLDHGGFTVHDARIAFRIHEGLAITFVFGAKETVDEWYPMKMARNLEGVVRGIENTVRGVGNTTFGIHASCEL